MTDLNQPKDPQSPNTTSSEGVKLSPRAMVAIGIGVVCLIFVFSNLSEVTLNFLWIGIEAPAWMFLFLLLALGALAGFMLGRNRYKNKGPKN